MRQHADAHRQSQRHDPRRGDGQVVPDPPVTAQRLRHRGDQGVRGVVAVQREVGMRPFGTAYRGPELGTIWAMVRRTTNAGRFTAKWNVSGTSLRKLFGIRGLAAKVGAPRRRRVVRRRCAPLAALTFACKCSRWEPGRPGAKSLWLLPSGSDQVGDDPVRPTPAAHMAGSDGMIKPLYGLTRGKARS